MSYSFFCGCVNLDHEVIHLRSDCRLSSTAAVAMLDADCEEEIALDTDVDEDFDCISMADSAVSSSAESVASVSACSISIVDLVSDSQHILLKFSDMPPNVPDIPTYQPDLITHSSATPRWTLSSVTAAPGRTRG